MANHALSSQLPSRASMVRKPKFVWPGLIEMGMFQYQIAGDGNCLFASLSDQLYGTPDKHLEIRASIIEHMRTFRPLFEHYVSIDDVQQRRTLRSATLSARQEPEDAFEEYLTKMSCSGTYGGEPELVAFCQVFDQDVTVHLPRITTFEKDFISYTNEHRETRAAAAPLHICYGGDEVTRAHYDSARSRDGSIPRHTNSPHLKPQDSTRKALTSASPHGVINNRALRGSRAELSSDFIQDMLQKSPRGIETSLDHLNDKYRARSPSVSSSQRSASSKRSLDDDDDEPIRSSKRADRRKSTRRRAEMTVTVSGPDSELSPLVPTDSQSTSTPPSTQDTDVSSDCLNLEDIQGMNAISSATATESNDVHGKAVTGPTKLQLKTHPRITINLVPSRALASAPESPNTRMMSVAERPKSTLRA